MNKPYITSSTVNQITTIEFYHPAHNSLPGTLLRQIVQQIQEADQNPLAKLIVLKSGGDRTFCAGASFDELMAIDNADNGKIFFMGFANVINAIRKCSKIVIGRVQGKAVGGGVGVAAAVDYCMATKYASVKLSELALGIGPFVIGPAVKRKIGLSAFSQLAIDAEEWQTAEWAKNKGLYTDVFEATAQLDEYVTYFANSLAKKNPQALSILKKVFWEGTDHWDQLLAKRAEISGKLILSDYTKKAINDIKTKA